GGDAGVDRPEVVVAAGDDVLETGAIANSLVPCRGVDADFPRTRVAVNDLILIRRAESVAFVKRHSGGRAEPGDENVRNKTRLGGGPVMDRVETAVGIADIFGRAEPAVVAPFENPADADALQAIVIVVAAPYVAERIDRQLERVAEVDGEVF